MEHIHLQLFSTLYLPTQITDIFDLFCHNIAKERAINFHWDRQVLLFIIFDGNESLWSMEGWLCMIELMESYGKLFDLTQNVLGGRLMSSSRGAKGLINCMGVLAGEYNLLNLSFLPWTQLFLSKPTFHIPLSYLSFHLTMFAEHCSQILKLFHFFQFFS